MKKLRNKILLSTLMITLIFGNIIYGLPDMRYQPIITIPPKVLVDQTYFTEFYISNVSTRTAIMKKVSVIFEDGTPKGNFKFIYQKSVLECVMGNALEPNQSCLVIGVLDTTGASGCYYPIYGFDYSFKKGTENMAGFYYDHPYEVVKSE